MLIFSIFTMKGWNIKKIFYDDDKSRKAEKNDSRGRTSQYVCLQLRSIYLLQTKKKQQLFRGFFVPSFLFAASDL